jgi:hypothetical protein
MYLVLNEAIMHMVEPKDITFKHKIFSIIFKLVNDSLSEEERGAEWGLEKYSLQLSAPTKLWYT